MPPIYLLVNTTPDPVLPPKRKELVESRERPTQVSSTNTLTTPSTILPRKQKNQSLQGLVPLLLGSRSQSSKSEEPLQRLPPVPSLTSPDEEDEDNLPLGKLQSELRRTKPKTRTRGVFKTKEHGIKKKEVQDRKYRCKICGASVEGARALTKHHQKDHGILYCDHCQKAFNNQRSLAKHLYTHKTLKFKCNKCGKAFPFKSQLTTHRISHREATHKCMHGKCDRTFKNIGDLNRHARTHTAKWIVCPDCPNYKTKDKRNFESHRQHHNQIEKYWCNICGEGFVHSTQKSRHKAQKNCKKA